MIIIPKIEENFLGINRCHLIENDTLFSYDSIAFPYSTFLSASNVLWQDLAIATPFEQWFESDESLPYRADVIYSLWSDGCAEFASRLKPSYLSYLRTFSNPNFKDNKDKLREYRLSIIDSDIYRYHQEIIQSSVLLRNLAIEFQCNKLPERLALIYAVNDTDKLEITYHPITVTLLDYLYVADSANTSNRFQYQHTGKFKPA